MRDRLHLQRGVQRSSIKLAQPDIDFPHLISEYLVSSIKYHEEVVYADVPAPDRLRRESGGAVTQPPSSGRLRTSCRKRLVLITVLLSEGSDRRGKTHGKAQTLFTVLCFLVDPARPGSRWARTESGGPVRSQVGPYGVRRARTESGGPVRSQAGPYGVRWARTESGAFIRSHTESTASVRNQEYPYGEESAARA